jgi:plasmid stabilization system protein ParE
VSRRLTISPAAEADLEAQQDFLLDRDPSAAVRLQDAAFRAYHQLLESPKLGSSRGVLCDRLKDLRMWPVPEFPMLLIFYIPRPPRGIEILRLLHSRQDRDSILGDA